MRLDWFLGSGKTEQSNIEYLNAFPLSLRDDAIVALAEFPAKPNYKSNAFTVMVGSEIIALPYRIYHERTGIDTARLTVLQNELVNCLLTRHHDGFVRQRALAQIICSNHLWVSPFVVQLVGEYVVEILDVIHHNLGNLDASVYRRFLEENPEFFRLTEHRVISYWDCYHRGVKRDEYVGFRLLDFLKSLVGENELRSRG